MAERKQFSQAEISDHVLSIITKALGTIPAAGLIEGFEDSTEWTTTNAAVSDSVSHVAGGAQSVKMDKTGSGEPAIIEKVFTDATRINLDDVALLGLLKIFVFIPTGAAVANFLGLRLRLGTDSSNYAEWEELIGSLVENTFNEIDFALKFPDFVVGNGLDYKRVTYIAVTLEFTNDADTDEDYLIDSLYVVPQQANL